jgi:hypothetical protein
MLARRIAVEPVRALGAEPGHRGRGAGEAAAALVAAALVRRRQGAAL